MYLVKLSVRDEWFSVITRIEILGLVRLLKTISLKKGHRAIPTMELSVSLFLNILMLVLFNR